MNGSRDKNDKDDLKIEQMREIVCNLLWRVFGWEKKATLREEMKRKKEIKNSIILNDEIYQIIKASSMKILYSSNLLQVSLKFGVS